MKKVLYMCLGLVLLGGVGAGFWLMRQGNDSAVQPVVEESQTDQSTKTVREVIGQLDTLKHLEPLLAQTPGVAAIETAADIVLFVPSKTAVDTFTKDTALGLEKFLAYHLVSSTAPIAELAEGQKLKTADGQELIIVKVDNKLYVRDAKGNDARLRKPIQAKNGKIYLIDRVLLTQ